MAGENSRELKEHILSLTKEHNVKFIRMWFTDILGLLKSFAITVEELEGALEEGMGFDGSSIEGFARIDESDMVAMPDPATFDLPAKYRVATVDAHSIAIKHRLGPKSAPIVNTAILGAFARATGIVSLEAVAEAVRESVPLKPEENVAATREEYGDVRCGMWDKEKR